MTGALSCPAKPPIRRLATSLCNRAVPHAHRGTHGRVRQGHDVGCCSAKEGSFGGADSLDWETMGRLARRTVLLASALSFARPCAASGTATERIAGQYDKYSAMYDALDGGAAAEALGFPELRSALLSRARGRTLETAVGTGLNLPLYPGNEGSVSSLTAVDVSRGMLERARARAAGVGTAVAQQATFVEGDVARLPFESDSFDTVLDTFSLCVFPDPSAALREMGRVLQPFGSLLLLEHSRSDNPLLASYQDLTSGAVAATAKGCVWNQDVEGMVRAAGMEVVNARRAAAGTVVLLEARKRPA